MRASKSDPLCYDNQGKSVTVTDQKNRVSKTPNGKKNPQCEGIVQRKMEEKYCSLLAEYRRVQQQESVLRNNMALLRAELILCQTQKYHRGLQDLGRITLDPIEIRRIDSKRSRYQCNQVKRPYIVQKYTSELGGGALRRIPRNFSKLRYTLPTIVKENSTIKSKIMTSNNEGNTKMSEVSKGLANKKESSNDKCSCSNCINFPPTVVRPPRILIIKKSPQVYKTNYRLQKHSFPPIQEKEKSNV
ncbi:uncharacterized protein LOC133171490 [Saccostrea echinata]|uniref:uncharacterized protein LOC133171490 n=1 Tax=Saccostrea echinata TaxID=191078 RepID=UPI002A82C908|nr:uncharacterized protein LOC133171490 [Saccostrea echinata]